MTDAEIFSGIDPAVQSRIEAITDPPMAALALKDCFWTPTLGEMGCHRTAPRAEIIARCVALYRHKDGADVDGFEAFCDRTFAKEVQE